jgi:hypothetical protein
MKPGRFTEVACKRDASRRASGAATQDALARRHDASGDVAAGVHAMVGRAGSQTATASEKSIGLGLEAVIRIRTTHEHILH